jgi:hypothetical protein
MKTARLSKFFQVVPKAIKVETKIPMQRMRKMVMKMVEEGYNVADPTRLDWSLKLLLTRGLRIFSIGHGSVD